VKWINAAGILLQFLSFWLAAPELLGIERLRAIEGRIRALIGRLPRLVFTLAGLSMAVFGTWFGIHAATTPRFLHDHPLALPVYFIGVTLLTLPLILFQHRITAALDRWIVAPLLRRLIADEGIRLRALFLAAVLMTLGVIMQLAATLWT
jgi:hypothetical protein